MKNRWTLRKWVLLAYGAVALVAVGISYVLAFRGSETASDITLALLAMFDAAFIAYLAADCADHNSKNKYCSQHNEEGDAE